MSYFAKVTFFALVIFTLLAGCSARKKEFIDVNKMVAVACPKPREITAPTTKCLFAYSDPATVPVDIKVKCLAEVYFDAKRYNDAASEILRGYDYPLTVS